MRYVTTITIIHEAADGKQAIEHADTITQELRTSLVPDSNVRAVSRYNTQVVPEEHRTTQRRNSTVGK